MAALDTLMRANLLEVFGERDPERRLEAIRRTYSEDVLFADPDEVVRGHDALNAKAQKLLDDAPGFVFRVRGDYHRAQDLGYLAWEFGPADGAAVVNGVDIGIAEDGLLTKVYTILFS